MRAALAMTMVVIVAHAMAFSWGRVTQFVAWSRRAGTLPMLHDAQAVSRRTIQLAASQPQFQPPMAETGVIAT